MTTGTVPRDMAATIDGHDAGRRGGLGMQLQGPTTAGLMYSQTGGARPVRLDDPGRWRDDYSPG
ncbi:MAG: hypothetical protein OXH28_02265 [bacterium]|nr:hypothetical protein [bacterium]